MAITTSLIPPEYLVHQQKMGHSHVHPARVWSLLASQEIALKQVWAILLKSFGYGVNVTNDDIKHGKNLVSSYTQNNKYAGSVALTISVSKESSSMNLESSSFMLQTSCNNIKSIYYSLETDNYNEDEDVFSLYHQELHPLLTNYIPEDLHRAFWAMGRNDNPDNALLRYMRIANFDVKTTVKWWAEAMDWRLNKFGVDDLLYNGDAQIYFEGNLPKMIDTMRRNVVYIRGHARNGCPLVHIRACKHFRSNCLDEEFELFTTLIFEWSRLGLLEYKKGVDRAHVLYDLSGFTLKNADFHAVKFSVKAFQRWYPDVVKKVYIHNAPRVFSVMWNIILKWLKPYLREKIVFTRGPEALKKYIDPLNIPKSLGGLDIIPPYVEPTKENSQRKEPDTLFSNLMKQRDELTVRFIEATIRWIEATSPEESRAFLESKISIAKARAQNYVYLDPYLRTRGITDRNGQLTNLTI